MGVRVLRLAVLAAAAYVALAFPAGAYAERTIGLSSGTFKFEVAAGQESTGTVILANDGDEPVKVLVYAADQEVGEKGDVDYKAPTRADITQLDRPSSWISVRMPQDSQSLGNVPFIELDPGERVPVSFVIKVPAVVTPGDHNMLLFFEMFDTGGQGAGAQMSVSGRLGTRITMRIAGELFQRLTIRPFEVPAVVVGSAVPYNLLVNQGGNVDQRVTVNAMLRNRSGNDIASQTPVDALLVFAGESREASGSLIADAALIGPYTVAVDVIPVDDEGRPLDQGSGVLSEQRQVWVLPMWLVVAAGAVLALLLARVVWAFARKAAREAHAKEVATDQATPTETPVTEAE